MSAQAMSATAYPDAFVYAVSRTLDAEGVFSNHRADRGGATKYGITERLARRYGYDVRELTREQAIEIYFKEFWMGIGLDLVSNRLVQAELFDTAVNMGPNPAVECLQKALWFFGFYNGKIDGVLGPKTAEAIRAASRKYLEHLLLAMNGFQFMRYYDICDDNAEQREVFFKGWMARLRVPDDLKGGAA